MNKKFFAALASATMAFTASGSIAVFADDFVEENAPVLGGNDVKPNPTKVEFGKDNFGALASNKANVTFTFADGSAYTDTDLKVNEEIDTKVLAAVTKIELKADFEGEVKGLDYFTNLVTFDDTAMNANKKLENKTLDFSANTKLTTLKVTKATDLTKLALPKPFVDEEKTEFYNLDTLTLNKTKLTSLDLSKYDKLGKTGAVTVTENKNLKTIAVAKGTSAYPHVFAATVNFSGNSLEEIDLENCEFKDTLTLSKNRLGIIDLSKTKFADAKKLQATDQTLYVSEELATINVKDTFANADTRDFAGTGYNDRTGVLDLEKNNKTGYTYTALDRNDKPQELKVKVLPANPMHRLYNPNSGEHFYTADIKEKEALVALGWNDEGYGWVAPEKGQGVEVYRLYNPNAGDHHYTMSTEERDTLVAYGWKDEKTGWYSATKAKTEDQVIVYRQYNPNANGAGAHNYTTDKAENDYLVSLGWTYEGAGWLALR